MKRKFVGTDKKINTHQPVTPLRRGNTGCRQPHLSSRGPARPSPAARRGPPDGPAEAMLDEGKVRDKGGHAVPPSHRVAVGVSARAVRDVSRTRH